MQQEENKPATDQRPLAQEENDMQRGKTILEEIKWVNEQIMDPSVTTFQKTTYWNLQNSGNPADLLNGMTEQLARIEAKLTDIENILEKWNRGEPET